MSIPRPHRALLTALLLGAAPAAAGAPTAIPVPRHGALLLDLPDGWRARIQQPPGELPPTVRLEPASGREFGVLLTALWTRDGTALPLQKVRETVEESAADLLASAVEAELPLEELRGPSARGYHFTATDRAPKPGEWTHVTQGTAAIGTLVVTFSILTDGRDAPARRNALDLIAGARHDAGAVGDAEEPGQPPTLALRGRRWAVAVDAPGFQVGRREADPGGGAIRVLGTVPATGVNLSVFLEAAPEARSAADCRRIYWEEASRTPVPRARVKLSEREGVARVEYLVPAYEGIDLRQLHVHTYRFRDGACITAHASKVRFEPRDGPDLEAVLSSVRVRSP